MSMLVDWHYETVWIGDSPRTYRFRHAGDGEAFRDTVYRVIEEEGVAVAAAWVDDIAAMYGGRP